MRRLEHASQALPAHVGVELGRGEVGVAEKFLYSTKVGTAVQKMSGERVPEGVRIGGFVGPPIENSPHVPW